MLSPEAQVSEIRQAIAPILADAGVKKQAKNCTKSLVDHPGLDHAVGLVENLLPDQP